MILNDSIARDAVVSAPLGGANVPPSAGFAPPFMRTPSGPPYTAQKHRAPLWSYLLLLIPAIAIPLLQFHRFAEVAKFGFTPQYLSVADTTLAQHRFSDTVTLDDDRRIVIPEVQREPLYPAALIYAHNVLGAFDRLIDLQVAAMMIAYFLWGALALRELGWGPAAGLYLLLLAAPDEGFYSAVLYPYSFQFLLMTLGICCTAVAVRDRRFGRTARLGRGGAFAAPGMPISVADAGPASMQPRACNPLGWFLAGGAFIGAASYERGAYLALPIVLAIALWLVRGRLHLRVRHVAAFLLMGILVPLPWLIRNKRLGTTGMNQMMGYSLGFTYGDLAWKPRDDFERAYDASIKAHGTDGGSLNFIRTRAAIAIAGGDADVNGGARNASGDAKGDSAAIAVGPDRGTSAGDHTGSASEAGPGDVAGGAANLSANRGAMARVDAQVVHYVLRKMRSNPHGVYRRIKQNLAFFPCCLTRPSLDFLHSDQDVPRRFWRTFAARQPASAADWIVFVLGLGGLLMLAAAPQMRGLGVIFITVFIYTALFSTLLIKFDPRYRGVVDPILFLAASTAVVKSVGFLWRRIAGSRHASPVGSMTVTAVAAQE